MLLVTKEKQNPLSFPPNNPSFSFDICASLVSLTRSRSLLKGQQLHARVIKSGLQTLPLVSNHLINFYSKTQLPHLSRQIFYETPFRSSTSWSSIISTFAQNDLPLLSLHHFRQMLQTGIRPDHHIFPSTTKSCAILSRADIGKSIHSLAIKTGFDWDVFVGSSIVDMYAKCEVIQDARKLFDEMPHKNVVSWNGMIHGYTQIGENEQALHLFMQALFEDLEVSDFTLSSVILACGKLTLLELGKQIQGLCIKTSFSSSSFVGSALVSMYSKCGVIEGAYLAFDEIPVKNLGAWNSMLIACAQHGYMEKVFTLFNQMEVVGMQPNFITFLSVLLGCSHAGMVEKGRFFFDLMKNYGIEPGSQHYACMVDLLGRAGKLQEAFSVIEEMPVQPTESVWGALLMGCLIHGNIEMTAFAADKVYEHGNVSPGVCVLLSNAYAAAGKYVEAAKARKMLKDRGEKKETGLSWVEERNKIHTFAAGDRSHPKSKEIFEKLEELEEKMERAGYVVDTSFILRQVDGEEKKQDIRYHSEKLAIAFGLINFPLERPIRVMKNLRVCGDCHTWMKFVSRCTRRTLIVRDNNRFHRIVGGTCSCGDYW